MKQEQKINTRIKAFTCDVTGKKKRKRKECYKIFQCFLAPAVLSLPVCAARGPQCTRRRRPPQPGERQIPIICKTVAKGPAYPPRPPAGRRSKAAEEPRGREGEDGRPTIRSRRVFREIRMPSDTVISPRALPVRVPTGRGPYRTVGTPWAPAGPHPLLPDATPRRAARPGTPKNAPERPAGSSEPRENAAHRCSDTGNRIPRYLGTCPTPGRKITR